ncbi:MAG: hypothetical protein NC177_01150 [Ruminococcus flavefaciens]|nr:hypothetical protein [Ruminococcus flavefaciens]
MKKIIAFLISVVMCVGFCSCGEPVYEKTVDELLKNGDYKQAQIQAEGDEKDKVLAENMVACVIKDVIKSSAYKNALSLSRAWCDCSTGEVLVWVNGEVGMRYYDTTKKHYKYYKNGRFICESESPSPNNILDSNVKRILEIEVNYNLELSQDSIDNIQHLYDEGLLDSVSSIS